MNGVEAATGNGPPRPQSWGSQADARKMPCAAVEPSPRAGDWLPQDRGEGGPFPQDGGRRGRAPTVVARAPVRVSFGGGGTDLPAYSERYGGFVVSSAIDRGCLVTAAPSADGLVGINSADYRCWLRLDPTRRFGLDEPLSLPKAAVAWFLEQGALRRGVDLFLAAEVPPGSGLGSSSAMAVALVRALAASVGWAMDADEVAAAACRIELDLLGRPIGKQDQYAASFGGLNQIEFSTSGEVHVTPLAVPASTIAALDERLLLVATGHSRNSAALLGEQRAKTAADGATVERLHALKALAWEMRDALLGGDLDGFGRLLDRGWRLKRGLTDRVSSAAIDRWYDQALANGALGGKIAGAGGGGFLLLYVSPAKRGAVVDGLAADGLRPLAFGLARGGATAVRLPQPPEALPLRASAHASIGGAS